MPRHLIREASSGRTRVVGSGALPFFPGWVVLDTLDDNQPAFTYYDAAQADFRYVNVTELGDPASPARQALDGIYGSAPTTDAAKENYVPGRLSDVSLKAALGPVAGIVQSKAKPDGTDQTAVINGELQALYDLGGGTLVLPTGTIRCDGRIVQPNDGQTNPRSRGLRLTGAGTDEARDGGPRGGTILDLRYSGAPAKFFLNARARFEIDHLSLTDGGVSSTPFFLVTGTALHAHDLTVQGNPSKFGTTCDQDVFILGGTTTNQDGTATAGFQGYGTTIERVQCTRIRRVVLMRVWCNSVRVENMFVEADCGTNLAGGAAFEINNASVGFARDNTFRDLLIEVTNYVYGVNLLGGTARNRIEGVDCWDPTAMFVADVHIDATSSDNWILAHGENWNVVDDNGGNLVIRRDGTIKGKGLTVAATSGYAFSGSNNTAGTYTARFLNQFKGGIEAGQGGSPNALDVLDGGGTRRWGVRPGGIPAWMNTASAAAGSGSAALGANSPAVTPAAPYTWLKVVTPDGSDAFVPCWK